MFSMYQDVLKHDRCDFTIARQTSDIMILNFPLAKNIIPYTEQISRGYSNNRNCVCKKYLYSFIYLPVV